MMHIENLKYKIFLYGFENEKITLNVSPKYGKYIIL
jgi:hypothetical protein